MKNNESSEDQVYLSTETSIDKALYDQIVAELNQARADNIPNPIEHVIKTHRHNRLLVRSIVEREARILSRKSNKRA